MRETRCERISKVSELVKRSKENGELGRRREPRSWAMWTTYVHSALVDREQTSFTDREQTNIPQRQHGLRAASPHAEFPFLPKGRKRSTHQHQHHENGACHAPTRHSTRSPDFASTLAGIP